MGEHFFGVYENQIKTDNEEMVIGKSTTGDRARQALKQCTLFFFLRTHPVFAENGTVSGQRRGLGGEIVS